MAIVSACERLSLTVCPPLAETEKAGKVMLLIIVETHTDLLLLLSPARQPKLPRKRALDFTAVNGSFADRYFLYCSNKKK